MNSTSDQDRVNQQPPTAGKSAQIRDLVTAAADDDTQIWVIDSKAGHTDPRAAPEDDDEQRRATRTEREELFGFHPDILRQAAPSPRTLRRSSKGAGTAPPA